MSKLKRAALVLGVSGLVLTGLGLGWYQQHYVVPPEPKIKVVLPSPNGYDTLWEACNLEVGEKGGIVTSQSKDAAPQPLPGRLALLEANKPSIEKLREALKQEYLTPPAAVDTEFKRYAKIREEARMLKFASETYADSGNLPEAATCALDAIEIGATVPRGGVLIGGLVGVACEAIGMKALGDLADKLDSPTARMAAKRLTEIDKERPTFAAILLEEKRYSQSLTRRMFAGGPLRAWKAAASQLQGVDAMETVMTGGEETPSFSERASQFWYVAQVVYHGPKETLEGTERYLTELATLSEKPWSHPRATPKLPSDPMSQTMMPVFSQAENKWVGIRASNALLRTRLALSAYRQEKGRYPESLDALVSEGYLDAAPSDPFSPTRAPLGYRKDSAEKFTLWSVGPDAKDDGGKPIDMEGKRGYVDAGKPGDFVDGVNTY